jgi:hypothetical protein
MTMQTHNFIPPTYPAVRVSAHRRPQVRHCDVCGNPEIDNKKKRKKIIKMKEKKK